MRTIPFSLISLFVLLTCVAALGGASREGLLAHQIIDLASWVCLLLSAIFLPKDTIERLPKTVLVLAAVLLMWCGLQLLPLPADWFSTSSLHQQIATERSLLGVPNETMTISLLPAETIRSALAFGPPLLAFVLTSSLRNSDRLKLVLALLLIGTITLLLGVLQVFSSGGDRLRLWEFTNNGPVGLFANVNHQASFLAALLPFSLYLVSKYSLTHSSRDLEQARFFFLVSLFVVLLSGVVLAGSVAGYGLAVVALFASTRLFFRSESSAGQSRMRTIFAPILLIAVAFSGWLLLDPQIGNLGGSPLGTEEQSRLGIWTRSLGVVREYWATGTGLGTFEEVYRVYEDGNIVNRTFVNHAHNDFLEWFLEMGVIGTLIVGIGILWYTKALASILFTPERYRGQLTNYSAAVGSLILILHSFVDYPLRTPLVATIFGCMLALAVTRAPRRKKGKTEKSTGIVL